MANNDYIQSLVKAILHLYEADATWLKTVPVREVFKGRTIWEGPVEVFSITGHPKAKHCFAWSHKAGPGDSEDRFVAVLEIPPVKTAKDAVKVAIAHEVRESKKN